MAGATVRVEIGEDIMFLPDDGPPVSLGSGLRTLRWYTETFGASSEGDLDAAARVEDGSGGVLFLPVDGEGSFVGMSYQSTSPECTRAVHEGIVHRAASTLATLVDLPATVVVSGPGAGSDLLVDLLARVIGAAVVTSGATPGRSSEPTDAQVSTHRALARLHAKGVAAVAAAGRVSS